MSAGVEHKKCPTISWSKVDTLIKPLMTKGVEHDPDGAHAQIVED